MSDRVRRHAAILRLVQDHTVRSQADLRDLLADLDIEVGQGTLSRDIRELGLVKRPGTQGDASYVVPVDTPDPAPTLRRLAPALFVSAEGVDHFLVIRTLTGGAQPLAVALDREAWDGILGTIAGDDTILVIVRDPADLHAVRARLQALARTT